MSSRDMPCWVVAMTVVEIGDIAVAGRGKYHKAVRHVMNLSARDRHEARDYLARVRCL